MKIASFGMIGDPHSAGHLVCGADRWRVSRTEAEKQKTPAITTRERQDVRELQLHLAMSTVAGIRRPCW
jgi:hypothetical protein